MTCTDALFDGMTSERLRSSRSSVQVYGFASVGIDEADRLHRAGRRSVTNSLVRIDLRRHRARPLPVVELEPARRGAHAHGRPDARVLVNGDGPAGQARGQACGEACGKGESVRSGSG